MVKKLFNLRSVAIIACLAATILLSGCDPSVLFGDEKSDSKAITVFGFNAPVAAGVINEAAKTIAVQVPSGTNVTALAPVIVLSSPLATVSPVSLAAQNFTNPVVYTVTAENGSTAQYIVTVTAGGVPPITGDGNGTQNNPFALDVIGGGSTGTLTETAQAVWYSFTANGRYELTVGDYLYKPNNAPSSLYTADVRVSVLDASFGVVKDINNRQMNAVDIGNTDNADVTLTDLSGIYYVKIEPYSNGGKGTFYVALANTGPVTAGTSPETAIDITGYTPVPFELEITSSRPARWFKFTADGRYELTVGDYQYRHAGAASSPYTLDARVSVLDANLSVMGDIRNRQMNAVDIGSNNNAVVTLTDLSGVYYVKIDPYSTNGVGSFLLDLAKTGPVTAGAGQADAILLTIGAPRITEELTSSRPTRWFKFTAATGSAALTVYDSSYNPTGLTEEEPTVDLRVTVLDANLSFVNDANNRQMNMVDIGNNNQSPVNFNNLTPGGVYYVKIDPYSANQFGFFYVGVN